MSHYPEERAGRLMYARGGNYPIQLWKHRRLPQWLLQKLLGCGDSRLSPDSFYGNSSGWWKVSFPSSTPITFRERLACTPFSRDWRAGNIALSLQWLHGGIKRTVLSSTFWKTDTREHVEFLQLARGSKRTHHQQPTFVDCFRVSVQLQTKELKVKSSFLKQWCTFLSQWRNGLKFYTNFNDINSG